MRPHERVLAAFDAVEALEARVPIADLRAVWVGASALTALVVGPALL